MELISVRTLTEQIGVSCIYPAFSKDFPYSSFLQLYSVLVCIISVFIISALAIVMLFCNFLYKDFRFTYKFLLCTCMHEEPL